MGSKANYNKSLSVEVSILFSYAVYDDFTRASINCVLSNCQSNYTLVCRGRDNGFSNSVNKLLNEATSEYIILITDDFNIQNQGWDLCIISSLMSHWSEGVRIISPRTFDRTMKPISAQSQISGNIAASGVLPDCSMLVFKDIGFRYRDCYLTPKYANLDFCKQYSSYGHFVAVDGTTDMRRMRPCGARDDERDVRTFMSAWGNDSIANWGQRKVFK